MIFNEQLTKQLGRVFWRGSKQLTWDKILSTFHCFYVSTEPTYALVYATDEKGNFKDNSNWEVNYLTQFYLKKEVNLFNPRSKKDMITLEKIIVAKNVQYIFKNVLASLSTQDWVEFGEIKKDLLINFIKSAGYDGFVNWEKFSTDFNLKMNIDDNLRPQYSFTGIGIFDNEKFLQKGDIYQGFEEIKNIPKIKTYRDLELDFVKEILLSFLEENITKDSLVKKVLENKLVNKYLIRDRDIENLLNSLDLKKLFEIQQLRLNRKEKRFLGLE